jgi:GTP cyclohydrolase I
MNTKIKSPSDIPLEIIKNRKEFAKKRVKQIPKEFELKKIVVEENKVHYNGIVAIEPIHFSALCEHHQVGIRGKVYFAYVPTNYLIGLSQVARVVEYFLNPTREILQEEVTKQIADFIWEKIKPAGLWLIVKAEHDCMNMRGVKQRNSKTTTSEIRGSFINPDLRNETALLWRL